MSFAAAFAKTVGIEGGYSDSPDDPGGETIWGITVAVARAHGYTGAMQDMPIAAAQAIYQDAYWDLIHLDRVDGLSDVLSAKLFDIAVNCGVSVPVPFLQRALNVFNREQKDYPDVTVDGLLGAMSASALKSYLAVRGTLGVTVMMAALDAQLGERYIDLAGSNAALEDFEFGWFANRVVAAAA